TSTIIVPITPWRTNTRSERDGATTGCEFQLLSMATSLSRPVSDSDGCVILQKESLSLLSARPHAQDRSLFDVGSWADLIASLPQVHSQSEQRLTFATHPTRIRYRINSPETGLELSLKLYHAGDLR